MANHKSALKKHRQSLLNRSRNRQHRSHMMSRIKALRQAVEAGNLEQAREMLTGTLSLVDRGAKHGIIHDNAAARIKGRLTRAVNRLDAGA